MGGFRRFRGPRSAALAGHRTALENGDFTHATAAEELLNALLGRWPHKGLAVTDPELDARLSVT